MIKFAKRLYSPCLYLVMFLSMLGFATGCTANPTLLPPSATFTAYVPPVETATPSPVPTETATPTPTPTETPTPTATSTPTPRFVALPGTPLPTQAELIAFDSAPRLTGLASWTESDVVDLDWLPDGRTLVVSTSKGVGLYDPYTRERLRALYPRYEGIIGSAFSTNGAWLVVGSRLGTQAEGYTSQLELWRGPYWQPLGVFYSAVGALSSLAFSPDSKVLATAFASSKAEENLVALWDTGKWEITATLKTGPVLNLAFLPKGGFLASTPDRYAAKIWRISDRSLIRTLYSSFTGAINCLTFSPDGTRAATGHYDGVIRLWDIATGEVQTTLSASGEVVQSLAFSPDGRLLASGSSYKDPYVRVWSVDSGALLRTLDGHQNGVVVVTFSPDSQLLASASYDGTVYLWGVRP